MLRFRRNTWIAIIAVLILFLALIVTGYYFRELNNSPILRTEHWPTYIFFGFATVLGLIMTMLVFMKLGEREARDSQALLELLISVLDDVNNKGGRLSLLYFSPNPGQYDAQFGKGRHGRQMKRSFKRLENLVEKCLTNEKVTPVKWSILSGDGRDGTDMNKFLHNFYIAEHGDEEGFFEYQGKAREYYRTIRKIADKYPDRIEIKNIDVNWLTKKALKGHPVLILCAGHSKGFLGYMSFLSKVYDFNAIELPELTHFIHEIYDNFSDTYENNLESL